MTDINKSIDIIIDKIQTINSDTVNYIYFIWEIISNYRDPYYEINYPENDKLYVVTFNNKKYYGISNKLLANNPDRYVLFNKHVKGTSGIKWTDTLDNVKKYLNWRYTNISNSNNNVYKRYYFNFDDAVADKKLKIINTKYTIKREELENSIIKYKKLIEESENTKKHYNDCILKEDINIENYKKEISNLEIEINNLHI